MRPFCAAMILFAASAAHATDVYKCIDADGRIAYQATPCPAHANARRLHLPDAPPAPAPTPPPAAGNSEPPPGRAAAAAQPAPRPLPALWSCMNAEDGSRYFSENGHPPVRYVPLGTLGYPGKSLAQAYGPGGGSGISAPGVNPIPIGTSPRDAAAADYTPLQDACVPATRDQVCAYLRKQYDEVEHRLKRAFKDERRELEPREAELETQLSGC